MGQNSGFPAIGAVALFWLGYVAITLAVGFLTASLIGQETWQLTAWGLLSSVCLIALTLLFIRRGAVPVTVELGASYRGLLQLALGLLLGAISFGVHILIVSTFAGPVHFERVPAVGVLVALVFVLRFLATAWMEELGFRGYTLQRLMPAIGLWPTVWLTAIVFGLSHLLYGWDLQTIVVGVIPAGLLWGISAVVSRGIAMPVGLHAAWNFSGWSAGSRAETGWFQMVIPEASLSTTRVVGTVSYLVVFGAMIAGFWFYHQRR